MKTHWLYGMGPNKALDFNVEIDKETECSRCLHRKVCAYKMEERCVNYRFGTSEHTGCHGCIHRFTRWDKDAVPCFHCKEFSLDPAANPPRDPGEGKDL